MGPMSRLRYDLESQPQQRLQHPTHSPRVLSYLTPVVEGASASANKLQSSPTSHCPCSHGKLNLVSEAEARSEAKKK